MSRFFKIVRGNTAYLYSSDNTDKLYTVLPIDQVENYSETVEVFVRKMNQTTPIIHMDNIAKIEPERMYCDKLNETFGHRVVFKCYEIHLNNGSIVYVQAEDLMNSLDTFQREELRL